MSTKPALIVDAYTRAADTFDRLPFWHHYGQRTVELLTLDAGDRVVDLCCGTGASALPAARAVGPTGAVLGVDLTPALLAVGRARAAVEGLAQLRFETGDVTALDLAPGSLDAVVSVFGLFFLHDPSAMLQRAWHWLDAGGRLATTVWGERVLSPGEEYFWDAVRREDATLDHVSPAAALSTPAALRQAHAAAGLPPPRITHEPWRMPLASAADFWPVILGTSNRGVFDRLSPQAQARVRHATLERLRDERVEALEMEALVAIVHKA